MYDDLMGRYYNELEYPDSIETFKKFTLALDKLRGENYSEVFPKLGRIL